MPRSRSITARSSCIAASRSWPRRCSNPGMERVHAVYLGYGSREAWLREMADGPAIRRADPRASRPCRRPCCRSGWPRRTSGSCRSRRARLNHRLSSPNKLFESLATGLPVVVSDFLEMRRIVLEDPDGPLGAVCDPADPASVARAIRSILDLGPAERDALRARCLARRPRTMELGDRVGATGRALRLARARSGGLRNGRAASRGSRVAHVAAAARRGPRVGRPSRTTRRPAASAAATSITARVS